MTLTPFVVDSFGGLNLYQDPLEIGAAAAVNALNVDIDVPGRVRCRDGSTALTSAAASPHAFGMGYSNAGGVEHIVACVAPGTVTPYALSNGAATTTQAATPDSNNSFARFGSTSNSRLYLAANVGSIIYRWSGAAWANVAVPNTPNLAAVTPNDNRLALASSVASSVYFSAVNDPETYDSTDFVNLWAGDGEAIVALVRWRDKLFAFKQTKFAVFTGTGIDSDGGAIFNYYGVDSGRGVATTGAAVAGEEGVYFADATGIYLTTGDAPRYISRQIEPYLRAGSYGSLPSLNTTTNVVLVYHDRRLYVTWPGASNYVTVVYDPLRDAWLVWQLGARAMAAVPQSSTFRGLYFGENVSKKILKADPAATTDDGTAISWAYASGRYSMADPGQVAVTRESSLHGYGTVTVRLDSDLYSNQSAAVTLGTAPTVAEGWPLNVDQEGTWLQHTLSGTGVAAVSRIVHYVSSVKPVGVR